MALLLLALLAQDVNELLLEMDSDEPEIRRQAADKLRKLGAAALVRVKEEHLSVEARDLLRCLRIQHQKELQVAQIKRLMPAFLAERLAFTTETLDDPETMAHFSKNLACHLSSVEPMDRPKAAATVRWTLSHLRGTSTTPLEFLRNMPGLSGWREEHRITIAEGILPFLESPDSDVRDLAVDALKKLEWLAPAPKVTTLLQDSDKGVRDAAKAFLAQPAALPYAASVLPLLDSEASREAMEILAAMNCVDAIPKIAAKLEDKRLRDDAAYALAILGSEAASKKILSFFADTRDNRTVLAAGLLGIQEAIPALRKFAQDDDFLVRKHALIALSMLGVRDHLGDIEAFCKDNRCEPDHFEVLFSLNARQHPVLFRRLFRTHIGFSYSGVQVIKKVAEWIKAHEPDLKHFEDYHYRTYSSTSYYEAFKSCRRFQANPMIILEADAIRLTSFAEALEYWRKQK